MLFVADQREPVSRPGHPGTDEISALKRLLEDEQAVTRSRALPLEALGGEGQAVHAIPYLQISKHQVNRASLQGSARSDLLSRVNL
jgi:hypothetical protein